MDFKAVLLPIFSIVFALGVAAICIWYVRRIKRSREE
jgi:hypothetical protein